MFGRYSGTGTAESNRGNAKLSVSEQAVWTRCESATLTCPTHDIPLVFVGTEKKKLMRGFRAAPQMEITAMVFKCPFRECCYSVLTT